MRSSREQRVVDRQHRAAGIAEHEFDPLPDQAFDQDLRAAALVLTVDFLRIVLVAA